MLRGLYAIADTRLLKGEQLVTAVENALLGGARIIQYRDKRSDRHTREKHASHLLQICRASGCPLIINDDIELALQINADGVHLGRADCNITEARARLGQDKLIGASCYDSLDRARQARNDGADYVAFGCFFPSRTKPDAVKVHPDILTQASTQLSVPRVAIGGITVENGAQLIKAGADMLAVIQGVFGQPDVLQAACHLSALFGRQPPTPWHLSCSRRTRKFP